MSDHWNSIANLLKTPSLNPTTKKTDGPAKPAKVTAPVETSARSEEPQPPQVEAPKAKPEPSRLRSSWDAVATFFGVAAPEQQSEPDPKSSPDAQTASKGSAGSKKSKPSMWGDSPDEPAVVEKAEKTVAPVEKASPRSEEKADVPEFPRARSRGRDRGPRSDDAERNDLPASEPTVRRAAATDRVDETRSVDPERRSQRQQPRRGRQPDVRAEKAFGDAEFAPEAMIDAPEVFETENRDRDESPREESSRPPRGRGNRETRPDRGPRPERAGRDDRPPRPQAEGRTERPARPTREDGFDREVVSERPERHPRSEESARPSRAEGQPRPSRSENTRGDRPARPERRDRAPRSERAPRADVSERSERPPRSEVTRTERTPRPERTTRGEGDRPARAERSDQPAASRVDRTNRTAPADRRPSPSNPPKKTSGFGAGIHDDDSFAFVEDTNESPIDFDFAPSSPSVESDEETVSEFGEREPRPRRRRGRGRRNGPRTNDGEPSTESRANDEDRIEEDDDSSDFISKNSRIPSWQETIGTLVTVNMENHQRNQSQNRPPRGRGPRRG